MTHESSKQAENQTKTTASWKHFRISSKQERGKRTEMKSNKAPSTLVDQW